MRLKEVNEVIAVLEKYSLDDNKNWRPEVKNAILLLQKEKILRERQRRNMMDNFEAKSPSY